MESRSNIRVAVCGASGKMGQAVIRAVLAETSCTLVAAIDLASVGQNAALVAGLVSPSSQVVIETDLRSALKRTNVDVCVDFTHPSVGFENACTIIESGSRPVIGTTGFTPDQLSQLDSALNARGLGGIVAPNFALGAVLMMKFSQEAAQYFDHMEIVELHHNRKADAPSGTALKTAELMAESLVTRGIEAVTASEVPEKETHAGARGASGAGGIHIHSVRLPGLVAHQEVFLAGPGQLLTLRHDSFDRQSFMPGVILAVKRVISLSGLTYGLEHIL